MLAGPTVGAAASAGGERMAAVRLRPALEPSPTTVVRRAQACANAWPTTSRNCLNWQAMEAGALGHAATRYAVSYPAPDPAAPTPGSQIYPLSITNAMMPSGPEDGRTLSSSREVILQGERTQVWREVMFVIGLLTGTVMSITSAVYIAGTLSGKQEMVTAAEYCLPLVTLPFPALCVILRCVRRYV